MNQATLTILQYNVRKSRDEVMTTLLRDPKIQDYDILAIQEPWRNLFTSTTYNLVTDTFHLCFPRDSREALARVCFFVNKRIDQASWRLVECTRDISMLELMSTGVQTGKGNQVAIHNMYNLCKHSENRTSCLPMLKEALSTYKNTSQIALGDFNLHYKY
jgi:hypothetical protein